MLSLFLSLSLSPSSDSSISLHNYCLVFASRLSLFLYLSLLFSSPLSLKGAHAYNTDKLSLSPSLCVCFANVQQTPAETADTKRGRKTKTPPLKSSDSFLQQQQKQQNCLLISLTLFDGV